MAKAAQEKKPTEKPTRTGVPKSPGRTAQAAERPAAQKTPSRRGRGKVTQGNRYSCDVCGLVVSVDEVCGCVDTCDLICCGEEMKLKK